MTSGCSFEESETTPSYGAPAQPRLHFHLAEPRSGRVTFSFGLTGLGLQHYEQACEHVPRRDRERSRIFREFGILLKSSGTVTAYRDAAEKLRIALGEDPSDRFARHALGDVLVKMGAYQEAIEVLEPLLGNSHRDTRHLTYGLLHECYTQIGDLMRLAKLRDQMARDGKNPPADSRSRAR